MLKKKPKSIKIVKLFDKPTKTYTTTSIKYPRPYHYKLLIIYKNTNLNQAVGVLSKVGYQTLKNLRQHITFSFF